MQQYPVSYTHLDVYKRQARYSYDAFNRTVKVETFDGNVQVNRYDAEGLRHERCV